MKLDMTGWRGLRPFAGAAAILAASAVYAGGSNCPADLNGDGGVGPADLATLLGQWGGPGSADLNGNGSVGPEDLAQLLGAWGPCPPPAVCPNPAHNCFVTGSAGCSDATCCEAVCAVDPFCCNTSWDSICVNGALSICGDDACPNPAHDCCTTGTPGCSDVICCNVVCAVDPFCCNNSWDSVCVQGAVSLCGLTCEPEPDCGVPGTGNCCEPNGTPFCDDAECCEQICATDPFCCATAWDSACAAAAQVECGVCLSCGDPDAGDCCAANGTPFCNDAECCESICATDPFCCSTAWDSTCAAAAQVECNVCLSCGDPDAGDCCAANGTAYCDDADCCALICASDPFCCSTAWDSVCAAAAQIECNVCLSCGDPDAGDCCEPNGTAFCNDAACCDLICATDPFCCAVAWDTACANAAQLQCQTCFPAVCPNPDHSCFATGTPGCSDAFCCAAVCAVDPFCCNTSWDSLCVNRAVDECGNDACPNPAHSCFQTGTPGCSDAVCCNLICAADPFCCATSWDTLCVNAATASCP